MIELTKSVKTLKKEELERANHNNPPFASNNEALGVVLEEFAEAFQECGRLLVNVLGDCTVKWKPGMPELFRYVIAEKVDDDYLDLLEETTIKAAAELIQLAAMFSKWKQYNEAHG